MSMMPPRRSRDGVDRALEQALPVHKEAAAWPLPYFFADGQ